MTSKNVLAFFSYLGVTTQLTRVEHLTVHSVGSLDYKTFYGVEFCKGLHFGKLLLVNIRLGFKSHTIKLFTGVVLQYCNKLECLPQSVTSTLV